MCRPCGGGYGDPLLRSPHKVLADVLDGYVTTKSAASDYGVVFATDAVGTPSVDISATEALRAELSMATATAVAK